MGVAALLVKPTFDRLWYLYCTQSWQKLWPTVHLFVSQTIDVNRSRRIMTLNVFSLDRRFVLNKGERAQEHVLIWIGKTLWEEKNQKRMNSLVSSSNSSPADIFLTCILYINYFGLTTNVWYLLISCSGLAWKCFLRFKNESAIHIIFELSLTACMRRQRSWSVIW